MFKQVSYFIVVYLLAMCIVSVFNSFRTSPKVPENAPRRSDRSEVSEPSPTQISLTSDAPQIATPQTVMESTTKSLPQLIITVTVEEDEHINSKTTNTSNLFQRTVPPNTTGAVLTEIEKRKKFIVRICMRRFCRAYTDREEDNSKWNKKLLAG